MAPGWASATHLLSPPAGAALRPGERVEVRWTEPGADVDEFELLLLLGRGARSAVRLTPQLNPSTRSYLWTVPSLPADGARLVLRVGREGREEEDEPGPEFRILGTTQVPLAPLGFVRGEWWARGHHHTPIAPLGMTSPEQLSCTPGGGMPAVLPEITTFGSGVDRGSSIRGPGRNTHTTASAPPPPTPRQPVDFPLRP